MFFFTKLFAAIIFCCIPTLGYSTNSNDFFDSLPDNTILKFDNLYSDYTRIITELPNGQSDTIWIEAAINTQNNILLDGRREIICANTFITPIIDDNNPSFFKKTEDNETMLCIEGAKYPEDALSKNIIGKVHATFVVEKDGSLSNIVIDKPVYPSIDREAYRLLSEIKLLPCKLGDKAFRCRQEIAISFSTKTHGRTVGYIYIGDVEKLPDGIYKRHALNRTVTRSGATGNVLERTHSLIEFDIPENNKKLEKLLCKIVFEKDGNSLYEMGDNICKNFNGKISNKELKVKNANDLLITAHANGFKKDWYYSYYYEICLSNKSIYSDYSIEKKSISHNIIYGIKENRLLSVSDLLTPSFLEELSNDMGISDFSSLDIGMDDYFMYIGKESETYATISLSQENWSKFAPTLQDILGNKTSLPISFNQNDFDYEKEANYINEVVEHEDGSRTTTKIRKGLKTRFEGIQPVGIRKKIIRKPNIDKNEDLFYEYLTKVWKKNEIQPDSDGFTTNISFILNKDQSISNFQTNLIKGDEVFYKKFINIISNFPKWRSMLLSVEGPVKNYFNYNIECGGKVYEFVDEMPEYPGGFRELFKWISDEITIPDDVPADALKSRMFVKCIIEQDGSVSNAEIVSDTDLSLKKELERALANMPKWNPGKSNGKEVRVKTSFPLRINLVR